MAGVKPRTQPPWLQDDLDLTEDGDLLTLSTAVTSQSPPTGAVWESAQPDSNPAAASDAAPQSVPPITVSARAAKASPTETDMKDWANIQDAYEWAGFKERDGHHEIASSLMDKIKMEPSDTLEEFATIDPADFVNDLQAWSINGSPASSGKRAKHAASCMLLASSPDWMNHTLLPYSRKRTTSAKNRKSPGTPLNLELPKFPGLKHLQAPMILPLPRCTAAST